MGQYYRITINPRNEWDSDAREAKISPRELEVLLLIADGVSYMDIAELLGLKYQTIKTHSHNVVKKLEAGNVTQAFMLALAKGLIRVTTEMEKPGEKWHGVSHALGYYGKIKSLSEALNEPNET